MKRMIFAAILLITCFSVTDICRANEEPTLNKGHGTAYCLSGTMANGEKVRDGACAACNEWQGKTLAIYQRKPDGSIGNFIGYFEVLDKGGTDAIKSGKVIDVWKPDKESCQTFMDQIYEDDCKGKIYIQVIDAVG